MQSQRFVSGASMTSELYRERLYLGLMRENQVIVAIDTIVNSWF